MTDGIDTTNVIKGFQGKAINNEFIEEVEVEHGGYQAEYGRALGGIINVITKSGGNQFRGDLFGYRVGEHPGATDCYFAGFPDRDANHHRAARTSARIWAATSGRTGSGSSRPTTRGHAWHDFALQLDPNVPSTMLFPRDQTDNLYSGKLTWNIASHSNLVATAFSDPSTISGAARVEAGGLISSPRPDAWENQRKIGGLDYGLRFNELFGASAVLTAQASTHKDRLNCSSLARATRYERPTGPAWAAPRQSLPAGHRGTGTQLRNRGNRRNRRAPAEEYLRRDQYRLDAALYRGNHEIKLGGDYQTSKTTAITFYTGGQAVYEFNEFGQTYYEHDFFSKSPTDFTPVDNVNEAHSKDIGFFLQDSWKPIPGLTINAGLRWDQQRVRTPWATRFST